MISKGGSKDFRGIGLVGVLWNMLNGILNRIFTAEITFHDVLHGFRLGRGTGTSALEDKRLQQLMAMREAVIYEVFLDLQKAYNALDWYRCL